MCFTVSGMPVIGLYHGTAETLPLISLPMVYRQCVFLFGCHSCSLLLRLSRASVTSSITKITFEVQSLCVCARCLFIGMVHRSQFFGVGDNSHKRLLYSHCMLNAIIIRHRRKKSSISKKLIDIHHTHRNDPFSVVSYF